MLAVHFLFNSICRDGVFFTHFCQDVPDELMPALIETLHGKPDKREDVVNSFVAQHPLCTKKAVRVLRATSYTCSAPVSHAEALGQLQQNIPALIFDSFDYASPPTLPVQNRTTRWSTDKRASPR